jgi:ElaB/YqjD/DUF883 family membrane-anchored ribosome-binding protein
MKCKRCENEVFGDFAFCSDECRKLFRVKKQKVKPVVDDEEVLWQKVNEAKLEIAARKAKVAKRLKQIPNFIKRVSVHNASNGKVLVKEGDGPVEIRPGYAATVSLSVEVKRLLMAGVLEMM